MKNALKLRLKKYLVISAKTNFRAKEVLANNSNEAFASAFFTCGYWLQLRISSPFANSANSQVGTALFSYDSG